MTSRYNVLNIYKKNIKGSNFNILHLMSTFLYVDSSKPYAFEKTKISISNDDKLKLKMSKSTSKSFYRVVLMLLFVRLFLATTEINIRRGVYIRLATLTSDFVVALSRQDRDFHRLPYFCFFVCFLLLLLFACLAE
jgi:hypothetical protein